jgi:hypothetical protein
MKHRLTLDAGRLDSELASLPALDRGQLAERWRALYAREPPSGVRDNFLIHAIAYRIQKKALGGLKPVTCRYMEKASNENASGQQKFWAMSFIKPGTRLLREGHGVTYEVIIKDEGVQCNGKVYRSLSEVARAITGTRWSGPVFFGLKKQEVA